MEIDVTLIEAFGAVFFFMLTAVSLYMYKKSHQNEVPLYLSGAMLLLFVREVIYFVADSGLIEQHFKIGGGVASALAGVLFMYVFIAQEKVLKDIRRIRDAFK